MRVIAGSLKGRLLAPVRGRIRPTGAKVREAVFNILGDAVFGVRVLDLFAGTGALGIEALSRGAADAVFVEEDEVALKVLRRNLADLDLLGCSQVLPLPALAALKKLVARGEQFGLAFLDPPYGREVVAATLTALGGGNLLVPQAWVVAETSRREEPPELVGALRRQELRRYGDTQVAFYLAAGQLNFR